MTRQGLGGLRVAVLRVGDGADGLAAALRDSGAVVATLRVGTVVQHSDDEVLEAVGELARFAWVAVTSANAAVCLSMWARAWPVATRVAAVGPATGRAIGALGVRCDTLAPRGTAASLATRIDEGPVLFLAGASATADLATALGAKGVDVTTVVVYDVERRPLDDDDARAIAASDVVVATSPASIDALDELPASKRGPALDVPLVALGPTTSRRARERGWPVAAESATRSPASVCDAVLATAGR